MTNLVLLALVCFKWQPGVDHAQAGYHLYCGGRSGVYTNTIVLGKDDTRACVQVARGSTNYFVLTAFDRDGVESLPTRELAYVSAGPSVVLTFQGSDDLRTWSPIAQATNRVDTTLLPRQYYRGVIEWR